MHDRFGESVEYWRNVEADARQYWLEIMAAEGEINSEYGSDNPDSVFIAEYEYNLPD